MRAVRYLSSEWFEAVRAELATLAYPAGRDEPPVTFGFVVTEPPSSHPRAGAPIAFALIADPARQRASVIDGSAEADVTFTTAYSVAHAVATGRQAAGRAFLDGSIRIGGDIAVLLERAGDLEPISGCFPEILPEADHA